MNRNLFNLGRLAAVLALGAPVILAQGTQTANISGEVTKAGKSPLAGALVRATSPALQGQRSAVTDEKGRFHFRLLPPGTYTIEVTSPGMLTFKTVQVIGLGQSFEPRFALQPVGQAVVEVIASASDIDKTDIKSATNYNLENLDRLPSGRTMEAAAFLTPGVTTGVGGRVQIRGAMTSGNLYLMDGQNISDNAYNNRGVRLIDDSVQEVQIITGALSAEYGNSDGGVLNAITKSGGNEYQGQLRWELSNPGWNAYQPMQSRTALTNKMSEEKTVSLNGYLIKDVLWFAASFFQTAQNGTGTISANLPTSPYVSPDPNGPGGFGTAYDTLRKEVRRQAKLTYAINKDHTLVASFTNARIDDVNRNYGAGEVLALVPQVSTSEFANLQWRAIWSNNLTSELKFGRKKQMLSAGGAPNGKSPIYNYTIGYFYNNGIFNSSDGGDNRNNQTLNFKTSLFWDASGSHQTDVGIDIYKGTSRARNDQSPTGYIFGAKRMDLKNRTAYPMDIWVYTSASGEANNNSQAIFVNDKWMMNNQVSFNIGLRFDDFKANNEAGTKTAGANGISPRLGLKWDVKGEGKHVLGASYARYNSKVLDGITNQVTNQGNPTEVDHPWKGAPGYYSFDYITDLTQILSRYDFNTITYYNNPSVNVKLASNLKAPTVDELQASYMYSFQDQAVGRGFTRVTAVTKEWKNLFDYRVGNDGTVLTPDGAAVYKKIWENSDLAKRKYQALEFDAQLERGPWLVAGNITWSSLRGNYEGEGGSSPARGEGLKYFTVQDGARMYDINTTTPYGYLGGHRPLTMRWTASRLDENKYGKSTYGFIYRFDKGGRWSVARSIAPTDLNANISDQFGTSSTQFRGERGGGGSYPSTAYLDFAFTHEFNLVKVMNKGVTAFAKLLISNVLNHQQIAGFNTQFADNSGSPLSTPFAYADPAKFGRPQSNNDFGGARTITASAGFRF